MRGVAKWASKMNENETTKYKRLTEERARLLDRMVKAQRASTNYLRKLNKIKEPTIREKTHSQKLIAAGLRSEALLLKKMTNWRRFCQKMKKKYGKAI